MANKEIKEAAKRAGIYLWQVANAYGISDGNFSRKLREEFSEVEKEKILSIIDRLAHEKREAI